MTKADEKMISKNAIIVIVVVVVIVVAAAAIYVLSDDEEDVDETIGTPGSFNVTDPTSRLMVFGNANNDDYLNDDDLKFIQDIVDGVTEWDSSAYPYADTNADGYVTQEDVEHLQAILDGETCLMYFTQYWDYSYSTSYIHYPATGNIGIAYYYQADLAILLDLWDRVIAVDEYTGSQPKYDTDGMGSLGAVSSMDVETVINSGIDILIAHMSSGTGEVIQEQLREAGLDIDVISVPYMGTACFSGAITMGVLLGCEDAAYKYIDYCDNILDYIYDAVSSIPESDYVTFVNTYSPTDSGNIEIHSNNAQDGTISGDLSYIQLLPIINVVDGEPNQFVYVDVEWFIDNDYDYIIISMSGSNSGVTWDYAEDRFNTYLDMFRGTEAYAEGKIIGVSYGMTATYAGCSTLALLAYAIYPEYIDEELAWEFYQQWYDEFTQEDVDVHEIGGGVFTMAS